MRFTAIGIAVDINGGLYIERRDAEERPDGSIEIFGVNSSWNNHRYVEPGSVARTIEEAQAAFITHREEVVDRLRHKFAVAQLALMNARAGRWRSES